MPIASSRTSLQTCRSAGGGLALVGLALVASCTSTTPSPVAAVGSATCPSWSATQSPTARPVRRLRFYTDRSTGDSAIEETVLPPKATPLLKTGTILYEYAFGAGSKVQVVVAPADLEIALHPAPYRESFLIVEGSVLMRLGNGTQRELGPGDLTVFEDTTASRGHGGRTGPCGYVALNIVP